MGRKKQYCKSCDWELDIQEEKYPSFHKDNESDVKRTNDYCERHTWTYGSECTPQWCEECGHLTIYQVTLTEKSKKMTPNFDRKRK
mgnify:CR=1 FL=1